MILYENAAVCAGQHEVSAEVVLSQRFPRLRRITRYPLGSNRFFHYMLLEIMRIVASKYLKSIDYLYFVGGRGSTTAGGNRDFWVRWGTFGAPQITASKKFLPEDTTLTDTTYIWPRIRGPQGPIHHPRFSPDPRRHNSERIPFLHSRCWCFGQDASLCPAPLLTFYIDAFH
jgi:hypothetical protein